jgi:CobQ-like glutamine amidotransferase family enzyme
MAIMYAINICHLYPDLLNLYGDRGNVIAIKKRCEWEGIEVNVTHISIGDSFDAEKYDMVFIGGGQDYEQELLRPDLLNEKAGEIKSYIEHGKVLLAICGGYQLLGHFYETLEGRKLKFLGALDFVTIAGTKRMIGNLVFECDFLKSETDDGILVGFENHMGKTFLGPGVKPMGRVVRGYGNNGEDGFEGAVYKNTYCSYGHGSLLPKNPVLADYLIRSALKNKYGKFIYPRQLNDALETQAHYSSLMRK